MKRKMVTMALAMIFFVNILAVGVHATGDKLYIQYDGAIHRYKGPFVKLLMDGEEIKTGDMPAIIITEVIEGKSYARTLVPVREICESAPLGAAVEWNGQKQEVYISYKDKFIVLKINDKKATVNNEEVVLDVPAKIIKDVNKEHGKTMVPLRFVIETFGYDVKWDGATSTAVMTKPIIDHPDPEPDKDPDENPDTNPDTDPDKDPDDNQDPDIDPGESLDTLTSSTAKKPLPTALKDQPIDWMVSDEELKEISDTYTESIVKKELHPTTAIKSVEFKEETFKKYFTIKASSAITNAKKIYWNNKLIIDIENAKWDMTTYEQIFDNNPVITGVRSSQFSLNPDITRVVFDLKGEGYKFDVALSDDRQSIQVTVMRNTIYGMHLGQNDQGDFIKVYGVKSPDVKAFRLSHPDRIVFDLPNTTSLLSTLTSEAMGQYVKTIRTAQFNKETTRVVVETDGQADFDITQTGQGLTMIQILEPSYSNIQYTNLDNPTIVLEKNGATMDLNKVSYMDDYLKKENTISLPGDYSKLFGKGNIKVNDGIIDSIDVYNNNGKTQLHIKANHIYEFRIRQDEENIYLKAYRPKELYSQIVVVDPGHGADDPGANCNGLFEKDVNLDMVMYAKKHLDQHDDIKVYYTRLDDTYPTLGERAQLANDIEADFFVSVHNNSFGTKAHGTETYYLSYSDTEGLNAYELADIFHDSLIKELDTYDRGTKKGNFLVLRETDMPAVLLEVAFLSNTEDAKRLKSEVFKKKSGLAIYNSIVETFKRFPTGR
ncbi:N-acetylmuramoyl-L-alanine amidase [Vallitalea pronyensis]|uniref:N-acetylmuramoyl-L-alanine amidase n=1 Tax=Vallitalea pronyensis TaxID=1348613 RepID=A0A8J8MHJ1_9FIRM|nr:N-acetylmuramoyl-L-alanine amidase family protein [Vallitalea pronyensis]QUI21729.1 N-acetylmuramoyl-L-alanine amidase [Vallitalea pronyensis]